MINFSEFKRVPLSFRGIDKKFFYDLQQYLEEEEGPLDDLNTMRFINMVEEMSKTVQFIFITHNKVSMEKSDHLMGVTMQEAGVSRMVSVDVNQALEFAEV